VGCHPMLGTPAKGSWGAYTTPCWLAPAWGPRQKFPGEVTRHGGPKELSARTLVSRHGVPKWGLWKGFSGAPTAAFAAVGYLLGPRRREAWVPPRGKGHGGPKRAPSSLGEGAA
jgi:hypothetical protein